MIKHAARKLNKVPNLKSTQHITFTSAQMFGRENCVPLLCLLAQLYLPSAFYRDTYRCFAYVHKEQGHMFICIFFICAHIIFCSIAVELRHRGPEFLADSKLDASHHASSTLLLPLFSTTITHAHMGASCSTVAMCLCRWHFARSVVSQARKCQGVVGESREVSYMPSIRTS